MNIRKNFIDYIMKVNRAVTLNEVLDETEVPDTDENYLRMKEEVEKLCDEGYVSSDLYTGEEFTTGKVRYYPTDKLFSEYS